MEKTASAIMLTLLLTSMLALAFSIQPVRAEGIIYIRADGSIDPPTAPIQRDGETYTLTSDIYINGMAIAVERTGITLDGAGHSIRAGSKYGVFLNGTSNVTVRNFRISNVMIGIELPPFADHNIVRDNYISNVDSGIRLFGASNNAFQNNVITATGYEGIETGWADTGSQVLWSDNNTFEGNVISNCGGVGVGIGGHNNVFVENIITGNGWGIRLDGADSFLRRNTIANNRYNIGMDCSSWEVVNSHDVDDSNTVDDKPICFWVNQHDRTVPADAGYVALVSCTRINILGLNISRNIQGIMLSSTDHTTISQCNLTDNLYSGLELHRSSYNVIQYNNITRTGATPNFYGDGIQSWALSDYNNITANRILVNHNRGIRFFYSWGGFVTANQLQDNAVGVSAQSSQQNVFHNNFVNNPTQVLADSSSTFDDGYPSGGNYWSNYDGVDQFRGIGQDVSGSDGIGDVPYKIDNQNLDHYPLMQQWKEALHDVAVTNVVASQTPITVGESFLVYVTVKNLGTQAETLAVTGYFGTAKIGFNATTVTLDAGENKTLNMQWNTTGVVPSNYQIGAYASQVQGETNLANNDYSDGTVVIKGLPDSPKNLVAQPMNSVVNLTWTAPSRMDVQMYHIYRGTSSDFELVGSDYRGHVDGSTLKFEDSVSENTIYYYKVVASFPEGFSAPSDAAACGRLESIKGVENVVTRVDSLSISDKLLIQHITLQQNFLVFADKYDEHNKELVYWCQNGIGQYVNLPVKLAWSLIEIRGPVTSDNIRGGFPHDTTIPPSQGIPSLASDTYTFKSEIDASYIVMQNSLGGTREFLDLGPNARIYTIASDYPPNALPPDDILNYRSLPPNFVIAGHCGGGQAVFTSGKGHVSTLFRVGSDWVAGTKFAAVSSGTQSAITLESSLGLQWESDGSYESVTDGDEEGIFSVPDFNSQKTQSTPLNTLSPSRNVIAIKAKCPVYLVLDDENGNSVGYNSSSGTVKIGIESAVWVSNQTIYVFDPSDTYRLIVVGTEDGDFTLQITLQDENCSATVLLNETDAISRGASKSWVMAPTIDGNYTVTAVSAFSASISPLSASTLIGQPVTFSSTVSGGYTPYSYQWYLNGAPVSGATSNTWAFTSTTSGIHYIYLRVTDANGNTMQSGTARMTAATIPVGGYSYSIQFHAKAEPILPCIALIVALTVVFTKLRPKTKRKR